MYFRNTKYPIAAKNYDSTLVKLNDKTREFAKIKKIRMDLDDLFYMKPLPIEMTVSCGFYVVHQINCVL
jgi:hypothetical protein